MRARPHLLLLDWRFWGDSLNLWLRSNRRISSLCCALTLTWRPRKKENWFERCNIGRKLLDNLKNDIIETKPLIGKCEKKVVVKHRRFGHMTVLQCERKLLNYAIRRFSLTLKTSCYTANFGIDPYSWMIIIIRRRRRRRRKRRRRNRNNHRRQRRWNLIYWHILM